MKSYVITIAVETFYWKPQTLTSWLGERDKSSANHECLYKFCANTLNICYKDASSGCWDISQKHKNVNLMVVQEEKSITKISVINPLVTMDISTNLHGNPCNICSDFSVWIKVVNCLTVALNKAGSRDFKINRTHIIIKGSISFNCFVFTKNYVWKKRLINCEIPDKKKHQHLLHAYNRGIIMPVMSHIVMYSMVTHTLGFTGCSILWLMESHMLSGGIFGLLLAAGISYKKSWLY